ncbi:hypothetical protein JXA27_06635 [Aerococcaceae bacterium zg-B36]|uniref:hypothetical protein n=1 Tax=Aerococcaceae bacterium zg-252 TaxID=2796928 RepID=UPI001BD8FD94|nr:hypothetical protein [Aerococcaceae bacterium zg-B36]
MLVNINNKLCYVEDLEDFRPFLSEEVFNAIEIFFNRRIEDKNKEMEVKMQEAFDEGLQVGYEEAKADYDL